MGATTLLRPWGGALAGAEEEEVAAPGVGRAGLLAAAAGEAPERVALARAQGAAPGLPRLPLARDLTLQ